MTVGMNIREAVCLGLVPRELECSLADKCAYIKDDGDQCGNWQMGASGWCFWHNPAVPESERMEARSKGGTATKYRPLPPSDTADPIAALSRAVAQLEDMKPSPEVLRTITAAASALDRAQDRQESRGADITRIEVVYVNDWREND